MWIVEPWVDGRRLDLIVAAHLDGGLTPEESVAVVVGVLAGLASTKGSCTATSGRRTSWWPPTARR